MHSMQSKIFLCCLGVYDIAETSSQGGMPPPRHLKKVLPPPPYIRECFNPAGGQDGSVGSSSLASMNQLYQGFLQQHCGHHINRVATVTDWNLQYLTVSSAVAEPQSVIRSQVEGRRSVTSIDGVWRKHVSHTCPLGPPERPNQLMVTEQGVLPSRPVAQYTARLVQTPHCSTPTCRRLLLGASLADG